MWILAVLVVIIVVVSYMRSEDEKRHFTTEVYTIESAKLVDGDKTFVFLSDLHDNCFGEEQKELLEAIKNVNPDGVLIGGDMIVANKKTGRADLDAALFLVRKLAANYPVYYGHGNHESRMEWSRDKFGDRYEQYHKELSKVGVQVLAGRQNVMLGTDIAISGLDLEPEHYYKFKPEQLEVSYIEKELGNTERDRFHILLAHSPVFFDSYAAWGADLSLAGHFHGGTIRIPYLGGLMTPQFQFFYPYCGGLFKKAGKYLLVSRGLGTHSVNIRLNNRSQLVVVKLIQI